MTINSAQLNGHPTSEILEIHKRMIGKTVLVIDGDPWYGEIRGVIDEEYFSISSAESPAPRKISMYKIRST
jgi:hypothetical protein